MKKLISLLLIPVLILGFAGCNSKTKKVDDAFKKISTAETSIIKYSEDIIGAWDLGINKENSIKGYTLVDKGYSYKTYDDKYEYKYKDGIKNFAENFSFSESEICEGIAHAFYGDKYETKVSSFDPDSVAEAYEGLFKSYGNAFSACVAIINSTYKITGKTASIEMLLEGAREILIKMSKNDSDSPYYEDLKQYFVNTMAFYDFCNEPTGTYDVAKVKISNFKTNGTTYYYNLYCFFGSKKDNEDVTNK